MNLNFDKALFLASFDYSDTATSIIIIFNSYQDRHHDRDESFFFFESIYYVYFSIIFSLEVNYDFCSNYMEVAILTWVQYFVLFKIEIKRNFTVNGVHVHWELSH